MAIADRAAGVSAALLGQTVLANEGGTVPVHQPMNGVKMVEVAQFTSTPSAGAVLAEWGADVIKIEHAVRGDAQRAW
jgi:hypothetical protein